MQPEFKNLSSRFRRIKERFAHAKTLEEKKELLAASWEIVLQAEKQLAEYKSKVRRMKRS
jgi:hypothetical protein